MVGEDNDNDFFDMDETLFTFWKQVLEEICLIKYSSRYSRTEMRRFIGLCLKEQDKKGQLDFNQASSDALLVCAPFMERLYLIKNEKKPSNTNILDAINEYLIAYDRGETEEFPYEQIVIPTVFPTKKKVLNPI